MPAAYAPAQNGQRRTNSLFCVLLAAFNLVLDFHFIEQAQANKLPKYMEWVGAFALVVTIIWLYIEFLRLLAKLKER